MKIEKRLILFILNNMIWLFLIGVILLFTALLPRFFLTIRNFKTMFWISSRFAFIVFAEAIVLIGGNFDLSVGQITGFVAMATAIIITTTGSGMPWYLGIIILLLMATVCGAVNGFFVGKLKFNAFLFTLGTYLVFFGGTLVLSTRPILNLPYNYLISGSNMTLSILIFIVSGLLLYFFLEKTKFAKHIYAVGGDERSSCMLGINTSNIVFFTYTLAGLFCGIAALLYTGYLSAATPMLADGTLFMAFAAAVLGGISIRGGRGSIIGVIGGILLIGVTKTGLVMMHISANEMNVIFGVMVIGAILIDRVREKIMAKIPTPT